MRRSFEPLPGPPLLGEGTSPKKVMQGTGRPPKRLTTLKPVIPLLGESAFDQMLVVAYTSATISCLCKSGTTLKQTIPLKGGL